MSSNNSQNAVKLFVFVDSLEYTSQHPKTVIVSKYKNFLDLKIEIKTHFLGSRYFGSIYQFAEKQHYLKEEQHWVMNKTYCYDDFEINEIISNMPSFKKGYVAFLFILSQQEKANIPEYFGSFITNRYHNVEPEHRWNEPEKSIMIIVDVVDLSKPQPVVGWNCDSCTFFNKPFLNYCDVCGCSRPENFVLPKNYYFTKDDQNRIKKDREILERAKKLEEESKRRIEKEKAENLEKLKKMCKESIALATEQVECPICASDCEPGTAIVLHNCLHSICKDCFRDYINNAQDPLIKCFEENCMGFIEDQEIREVLNDEEFERYQQLNLRTAELKTQNTFHCKTPNCVAWVVYDDDVNFFPCPLCKENNCLLCRAIHENQTCKEYQDELAIKARNDEAAKKDIAFLQNLIDTGQAMKCPGCQIIVQKKSGCDWMQCNMCKTEICWATKGPRWGPKGKGDNSGGCQCRVKGKCAPNCGNCH